MLWFSALPAALYEPCGMLWLRSVRQAAFE
jgi:hypothetical protein